jgi:hypothetical protein
MKSFLLIVIHQNWQNFFKPFVFGSFGGEITLSRNVVLLNYATLSIDMRDDNLIGINKSLSNKKVGNL